MGFSIHPIAASHPARDGPDEPEQLLWSRATAERLLDDGHEVILVGRTEATLIETAANRRMRMCTPPTSGAADRTLAPVQFAENYQNTYYAYWRLYTGSVNRGTVGFGETASNYTLTVPDRAPLGAWTWKPHGALNIDDYTSMTQNTPTSVARLGSKGS